MSVHQLRTRYINPSAGAKYTIKSNDNKFKIHEDALRNRCNVYEKSQ